MNKKKVWLSAGLAAGVFGLSLAVRQRRRQALASAWQELQPFRLDLLVCPACRGPLTSQVCSGETSLHCPACSKEYPVVDGIPHFIEPQELTGMNQRFARMYDWFSWVYRAFSFFAFAYIGMPEEQARREVTDRLEPKGGPILEVSIGPGVNLPYLVGRPDISDIHGLDISLGQLHRCQEFTALKRWPVQLALGNAEQLPYQDNMFGGVFHLGGINFFNDKKKAIEEMIRVARPGARLLICDENEKGARAYERVLPGFKRTTGAERPSVVPPVDLVPPEMQELRLFEVWNGWMYCIGFRKPLNPEVV